MIDLNESLKNGMNKEELKNDNALSVKALEYLREQWPVNSLEEGPKQISDIVKFLIRKKIKADDSKCSDKNVMARALILITNNLFENTAYNNTTSDALASFKETIKSLFSKDEVNSLSKCIDQDLLKVVYKDCSRSFNLLQDSAICERIRPTLIMLNLLNIETEEVKKLWNESCN